MARRPIPMIELDEVLYRWQQGHNISQIARSLGQSRNTVRKYLRLARKHGATCDGDQEQRSKVLATLKAKEISPAEVSSQSERRLAPYQEQICVWLTEPDMTMKQIWRLLQEQGVQLSYPSVKRYIRSNVAPVTPKVTVRLETPPGQQAQVDFGKVRAQIGEKVRHLWVFVLTLSFSRHRFVRFVERQDLPSWLDCHVRAFDFFGAVPQTILLDNLKAGVVRPDIYDPTLNRAYAEMERHYGFVADPAKVATPQHKGKVERQMPVVRQQLIAGRQYRDLAELNDQALLWCREQVGREPHGTTGEAPMTRFETLERDALLPLPAQPFDPPTWAEATVHPDHHLIFERSYYSVPTRYVGKKVWVRGTRRLVEIFCDDELIKTHARATRRGTWQSDENDYPDSAKAFLFAHPSWCRKKAAELGTHVSQMIEAILADNAIRNLRKAQGLLRFAEKYGPKRLDEACDYLLHFAVTDLRRVKHVLENGIPLYWKSNQDPQPAELTQQAMEFLHPPESFAAREVNR